MVTTMRRLGFIFAPLLLWVACLRTPPPHPRALECNELCAQYIASGDLHRAEVQCDLGLQFSPQYADLYVNKGIIAVRREQDDKAKDLFIKALRYNQDHAAAYNNLGYVYYRHREFGKAHDNFQRALKVNPDYTEARFNLALAFKDMGERDKARKELRTLLAVNANLADPHHWLGVMALEDHALEEAIEELQRATALDATYADAWFNLGNAYTEAARFAEAKDAYTSCIEADPKHVGCRNNVAIVNRKAKLQEEPLREAAENLSGQNTPQSLYLLARTYREKGLRNEEERAYRKCVKLDGRYAPCHFALYEVYVEDRRDKEAVIACRNFLKFAVAEEFPKEVESCERFVSSSTY